MVSNDISVPFKMTPNIVTESYFKIAYGMFFNEKEPFFLLVGPSIMKPIYQR